MNGILKASVRTMPVQTVYRVAGSVAVGSTLIALAVAALLHPFLGDVVGYVIWPLLVALLVWAIAGIARLRIVGFLPSEAEDFIPHRLGPWIRFWLLVRFGMLGAWLLLIITIIGTAVLGGPVTYCVNALVYLVLLRMLLDLGFGAAYNIGIISQRQSAR